MLFVHGNIEETCELRFVVRDGAHVLQQRVKVTDLESDLAPPYQRYEWRDIPVEEETK